MYSTPHGSRISYPYRHYKNSMKNLSGANIQYMVSPSFSVLFSPKKETPHYRILIHNDSGKWYAASHKMSLLFRKLWRIPNKNTGRDKPEEWPVSFILQAVKDLFSDTCVSRLGLVKNPINIEVGTFDISTSKTARKIQNTPKGVLNAKTQCCIKPMIPNAMKPTRKSLFAQRCIG